MQLKKYIGNPILCANPDCEWENLCVLNPAVIYDEENSEFNLASHMIESVGVSTAWSWGGYISSVREDGKMVYTSQHIYANGIALTDVAFAQIKEMAKTYGYSKLVATIYSMDVANIYNIFNNQKNIGGTNVKGTYKAFTENDTPFRYAIDYATFKDWTAMQIFYSDEAIMNAVFTLTLEKYDVAAKDQMTTVDSTFTFADLNVTVAGATGAVENLTYENFTVTSLNSAVLTYENGVFTAKAEGTAIVCIDYKGCKTYVNVMVTTGIEPYIVPFATFSAATTAPYNSGVLLNVGDGQVGAAQQTWAGSFIVEITGENWANLKALAQEKGYTKLVLTITGASDKMVLASDNANYSTIPALGFNMEGSYTNNLADFINYEKLIVVIAACPDTGANYQQVNFILTLEK